jgi:nitric oxide reductase subunit B
MLVMAIISYTIPVMTGTNTMNSAASTFAFWTSNIGMIAMTLAFGVAGVTQVYLERRVGMEFLAVQTELEVHFFGLVLAASLFTLGILAYIYSFIKAGLPREGGKISQEMA